MLATCPFCPGLLPPAASSCPHCGGPLGKSFLRRAAAVAAGAATSMTLMACYGIGPDDGSWVPDCAVDSCPQGMLCDEGSGQCYPDGQTTSAGVSAELYCDDAFDDDADGAVDCDDDDCETDPACAPPEQCQNGVDDDLDGDVDCSDEDCPACPLTEAWCGNFLDDDMDGLSDCGDPDCANECIVATCGDGVLAGLEECDDGNLARGDGCTSGCDVEWDVVCASAPALVVGENLGDTTGGTNGLSASCIPSGGRERILSFVAPSAGTLYLTLDASADLGLALFGPCADGGAVERACSESGPGPESASIVLGAGEEISVVVDAPMFGVVEPFQLVASFVAN